MAAKPETRLIERVHRALSAHVYREKTANPYRGGTPDCYYERAHNNILWVEYKYKPTQGRRILWDEAVTKLCSPKQKLWLERADDNGVPVAVITGFNDKTISITTPSDPECLGLLFDTRGCADWIERYDGTY